MMRRPSLGLTCFLLLGACSAAPPASKDSGALQAGEDARAFGVASYVVVDNVVTLRGADGAELGYLRVMQPTADTRMVDIHYTDGRVYENEVTRPLNGAFIAPLDPDREGAIQSDPTLAPFFAAFALSFHVVDMPLSDGPLSAEAIAYCSDVTLAPGCGDCGCPFHSDYTSGGIRYTAVQKTGVCPPVNCPEYQLDEVNKLRKCQDPGSCTNQAQGFDNQCRDYCWS